MSDAAVDFVRLGLVLVPIPRGQKGPRHKGWNQPHELVSTEEAARALNGDNLGLAHLESGTCALDVDDMPRAVEYLKAAGIDLAALLNDPKAVRVDSGRPGRAKAIFRRPLGVGWLPTLKLANGALELRCATKDGRSTVQDVIHGKHPDGGDYSLRGDLQSIPELPQELLHLWRGPKQPHVLSPATARKAVAAGMRNDYLTSQAGKLRHIGMSETAILGALRGINTSECTPPLADNEVCTIARSIAGYEPAEQRRRALPAFFDFIEFSELKIPPRKPILDPWVQQQSLVMVHGWRGVGKTNFALTAALSIATGVAFGPWEVREPQPVVYLDFEMDSPTMQRRIQSIANGLGRTPAAGFFKLYTPDMQPGRILNLAYAEDQSALEPFLEGCAVVFIDNLSAGFRGLVENDSDSAEPMIAAGCSPGTALLYFVTPPVPAPAEVRTDYIYLAGKVIAEVTVDQGTEAVTYLHSNLLGSPLAFTDANGTLKGPREHYDPWGMKLASPGPTSKIGYTGHAYDAETGYTYMQARFYDPLVGRFLSTDPIYFSDQNSFSFNRYTYANNNPYKYTDPSGMCAVRIHGCDAGGDVGSGLDGVEFKTCVGASRNPKCPTEQEEVDASRAAKKAATFVNVEAAIGKAVSNAMSRMIGGSSRSSETAGSTEAAGDSQVAQLFDPLFLLQEPPIIIRPPLVELPKDPTLPPGEGWIWRGRPGSTPGDRNGNWHNPDTGESLRPDMGHPRPIGPHWDYKAPDRQWYRWYPDGSLELKA